MGTFEKLQRKSSINAVGAPSRFLRPSRSFAPAALSPHEPASPAQQTPPRYDAGVRYSLAHIPIFRDEKENHTGLPDHLKTGIETLSGLSMQDVQVHYHSAQPAQVEALASTLGNEIHLGPGQEQSLAHEAWHVVQQKQGRVKPTLQLRDIQINTDPALEQEADVMGNKAAAGYTLADIHASPGEDTQEPSYLSAGTTLAAGTNGTNLSHGIAQPKAAMPGSLVMQLVQKRKRQGTGTGKGRKKQKNQPPSTTTSQIPTSNVNVSQQNVPASNVNVPQQNAVVANVNVPQQNVAVPNVNAPQQNVAVPNVNAPQQNVAVPNVNAPQQNAPAPNVNAPQQNAPASNVNVPQQNAPASNVNVPQQNAVVANVNAQPQNAVVANVNAQPQNAVVANVNAPQIGLTPALLNQLNQAKASTATPQERQQVLDAINQYIQTQGLVRFAQTAQGQPPIAIQMNYDATSSGNVLAYARYQSTGLTATITVTVYSVLFQKSVAAIYSTIIHELIHAAQRTASPDAPTTHNDPYMYEETDLLVVGQKKGDFQDFQNPLQEIETHVWEIEHATETGIDQDQTHYKETWIFLADYTQKLASAIKKERTSRRPRKRADAQGNRYTLPQYWKGYIRRALVLLLGLSQSTDQGIQTFLQTTEGAKLLQAQQALQGEYNQI